MSGLYLCASYDGEWKRTDNGWEWLGNERVVKGFIVERSLKFEEFIEKVYEKTGINNEMMSIEVSHKCDLSGRPPPVVIGSDSDLDDFFTLHAEDKSVQVFVEVKGKAICLAENAEVDYERGCIGFGEEHGRFGAEQQQIQLCCGKPLQQQLCRQIVPAVGSSSTPTTTVVGSNTSPAPAIGSDTAVAEWHLEDDDDTNINNNTDLLVNELTPIYEGNQLSPNEEFSPSEEFVEDPETNRDRSEASDHSNRRHDGSDLREGQQFESKEDMNYKLNLVAIQGKFEMKISKSTTTLKEVRCVDENCSWRVRAVKLPESNFFVIRRYNGFHTCTMMTRSIHHKQATSRLIATRMQGHFKSSKTPPKPKLLVELVRNDLELQCSYWKAWKAKKLAEDLVRGTPEHNFAILPSYCYMLKLANQGTVTHIEVDKENRFKYFFMALGAQIRGFRFMRKVIGIDGAWIKTKFRGVLLVASSQDSEYHSYPIAWGLVDSENNASWTWFLEKLKELIPDEPELCFISDRSQSIEHAVKLVYPQSKHGVCYFHVKMNIKHKFKSCASHPTFYNAAEAYTVEEFNKHFDELRRTFPRVAKYLEEDVKIERWSRANFQGNRYEVMTTNIVETVNHMMNEAREYPITALVDFVLETMGQWFLQRRIASYNMDNLHITPAREKIVRERWNVASSLTPIQLNSFEFHVKCGNQEAIVDLGAKRCQCRVFDIEGIPCIHAIAAVGKLHTQTTGEVVYSLCSEYYSVEYFRRAYAETIYPVAQQSRWSDIPEEISSMIVRVPEIKDSRKGRPRLSRFPSRGEVPKKLYRCSQCDGVGHSRRKCRNTNTTTDQH